MLVTAVDEIIIPERDAIMRTAPIESSEDGEFGIPWHPDRPSDTPLRSPIQHETNEHTMHNEPIERTKKLNIGYGRSAHQSGGTQPDTGVHHH